VNIVKIGVSTALVALVTAYALAQRANVASPPREVHVTQDSRYQWGELHVAINPRNPNNIVYHSVGVTFCEPGNKSRDCESVPSKMDPPVPGFPGGNRQRGFYDNPDFTAVYAFYSFDRGKTWAKTRLPKAPRGFPALDDQGDPSITVGPDGTFYASWDANDWGTPEKTLPRAGVAVSKSTDGGKSWSPPVLSGTPVDGPKLTADLNDGRIYVSSSTFLGPRSTGNSNVPMGTVNTRWLASSRDGVRWTPVQPMGGSPGNMSAAHGLFAVAFRASDQGSGPFGAPNGQLCAPAKPPCTIFQTTTNAGATWTRNVINVPNDHSTALVAANPARRGHFALALLRHNGGEYHLYQTRDSGKSWTGPAVVTEDGNRQHYHGAIAFSREGVLGLIWRSRVRPAPQPGQQPAQPFQQPRTPYSVWGAIARDGGATFSTVQQMSTAESPFGKGAPGDDYSGIALDREYLYAGWADARPGDRGGYLAALPFSSFKPKAR